MTSTAAVLVQGAEYWLTAGAVVAVLFLAIGIDRIDLDARGAYAFRPLLIPAILLIWPLVLLRWLRLERDRVGWAARYKPPRASHLPVALILGTALAFAVISGLTIRQSWPADIVPEHLGEVGT
ncbi:MAG: hypothetical protein GDA36_04090 [Rhodobacteraceae bacterium]|nr:hypothetical protein [Paracoccaceae bacterium]